MAGGNRRSDAVTGDERYSSRSFSENQQTALKFIYYLLEYFGSFSDRIPSLSLMLLQAMRAE